MAAYRAIVLVVVGLLICGATTTVAGTGAPEFRGAGSRQNTILQDPCPANEFPPIQIAFASVISQRLPGTSTGIRCITEVRSQGEPVRGVPIMLGGDLIDGDGNAVSALPTRSGTTNRAGQKTFTFPYSVPPPGSQLGVIMEGLLEGEDEIDAVDTTCGIVQRTPCNNTSTQACLSGKRFKVEVDVDNGFTEGKVIKASKTEALFYFFSPGSTDLLVQLLQRCTRNDHFWVFASSSTSVPFDLTVTDTFNGESRAYTNPGPLEPILDTAAFATCP
ncbi:MAG: hypothetical protein ACE5EG_08995 [Thermoanaerobaculia bacterium]